MDSEILDGTVKQSSKENSPELSKRIENSLEKGSLEYLFQDNFKRQNNESSNKELQQNFDDKDKNEEKFRSEISISNKDLDIYDEEITQFSKPTNKNFNFETLNRDLADIEERLRATRLSWNKNGKLSANESNEIGTTQKEVVRKSWSLLDIEKRPYSNGGSFNDLDYCKRFSGEKLVCESPALSEGLLKWDYGADIGLTQDDSDDMDPITWPVTAEQAQKEAQAHDRNGIGRRMKISLSQGSFLSSPDPEDRQNLIAKISAEYKSNKTTNSTKNNNINASTEIISLANGIYDDLSAKQIMEQAEAAEKRLRQRLEAVKALHLNDNFRNTDGSNESPIENCNEIHDSMRSPNYSDSPMSKDAYFDRNVSNNEFITGNMKNQQMKSIEGMSSELTKPNFTEDDCKSPTSLSYTGRTTTMESTHTSSDYGKAPLFTGEIYGSRKDSYFHENKFVMYSKHNRDPYIDKTKSADNKDLRNPRLICGIPPELDTISSRETLQITDEKKDDILSSPVAKTINDNGSTTKEIKRPEESIDHLSDKDLSQEHSLQAKWNQFKTMMKDEEYNNLKERTNIRSAIQYNQIPHVNIKSNDHCNTNRQQSTATTFTTITNISPRYDSFATEVFRNPHKEFHNNDYHFGKRKSGQENENKSNSGKMPEEKVTRTSDQKYGSSKYLSCHSRSGKRLASSGGGGGKDNEDNDDEISQTERRKLRHALELAKFKKRFGSGALDGETTASELEHDDISKFRKNLIVKDNKKKQLSQMLTEISKKGVADDSNQDITDVSESSSVDTLLLMNKMSHLLRKKNSENASKRDSRKSTNEKPYKNTLMNSNKREKPKINSKKVVESDDAKLILKHLMLKQKVKWLADCAREEARRRKIRKLQKLIDLYEEGNSIIIPEDLETDTATLMGSNRCSQEDLCSQSDLCSMYENEASNVVVPTSPEVDNKNFQSSKRHKNRSKSPSFRKNSGEKSSMPRKENSSKNQRKAYPMSEAWHIPLRDSDYQIPIRDFNDSNEYNCESPMSNENDENYYRSSRNPIHEYSPRPVNLTAKERFQLRRELQLARQRNANECQKDLRHSKTGNTKVTTGGLSWIFGASNMESNCMIQHNSRESDRKSNMCRAENFKDDDKVKSELQLAFESKMENFISKSRQRQKRIKLAVEERRYESQMNLERSRLFVTNNECQGAKKRRPVTRPDPLSADRKVKVSPKQVKKNHISRSSSLNGNKSPISERLYKPRRRYFSKSEMRVQSAKKYQSLPEVQAKYLDERRKARIQNNRMKMHLYGERILQSLLRNRGPWISNEN